jgi:hypothetical protein
LGEGIQVLFFFSNEGDSPSPRGENGERVKNTLKIFKNLLQNQ